MIRRFSLYIFALILLAYLACDTKNNIIPRFDKTFIKIYGGEFVDKAADFIVLDDGGFVILGSSLTAPAGTRDMLFIKTDKEGNIYKQKVLGDPLIDEEPLRILSDGDGFIICGNSIITPTSKWGFLFKIDANGDSLRPSVYTSFEQEGYEFKDMTKGLPANSIGVTGVNHSDSSIIQALINTENFDKLQSWDKSTGEGFAISSYKGKANPDPPHEIINMYKLLAYKTNIGTSVIVSNLNSYDGYLYYQAGGFTDVYPVTLISDSIASDVPIGDVTYRFTCYILGYLDQTNGSVPYIAKTRVWQTNPTDLLMTMTKATDKIMDKVNFRDIVPSDIKFTNDGNLLMIGTEVAVSGNKKIRLLKLDKDINVIVDKSFGTGDKGDQAIKLEVLPDGSVVFLATVDYQLGKTNTKIALYKLTPDLELDF